MSVTFALDVIMEEGECSRKIGAQSITKACNTQNYDVQTPAPSVDANLFKGNWLQKKVVQAFLYIFYDSIPILRMKLTFHTLVYC